MQEKGTKRISLTFQPKPMVWLACLLLMCLSENSVVGFLAISLPRCQRTRNTSPVISHARRLESLKLSPFANDLKEEPSERKQEERPIDKFEVGMAVRVSVEGLRARHVSPKGFGYFDENKSFVESQKDRCLRIPLGLQGRVAKIIDTSDISANYPIQVKFQPGETDAGYESPVTFLFHLSPKELEIVY